jgi:hypothetical protein
MNKPQGHRNQKYKGYYSDFKNRLKAKKETKARDRKSRIAAARTNITLGSYSRNRFLRSLENDRNDDNRGKPIKGKKTPAYLARVARRKESRKKSKEVRERERLDREQAAILKRIEEKEMSNH